MRVHHLDCGTLCPLSRRLINGDGSVFERGRMVCHCLLVETDAHGLVLVDTGIGLDDCADPRGRLGGAFVALTGLRPRPEQTARRRVEALGFSADDVRHVIVTHLDLDHAGGLPDFPRARVHVHADEHDAALARRTLAEQNRYRPCHFAHGPSWALYREGAGEPWHGFSCVRAPDGLPPEILLVPLPGHSRGHACVAVRTAKGWLFHAGDAYFHHATVEPEAGPPPAGIRLFERAVAFDWAKVMGNHARLRELARVGRASSEPVRVFSAHDPYELDAARSA